MSKIPVAPVALFSVATTVLDELGFSSERIVERAGLPQYQYLSPQAKLPGAHLYRLLGHVGRAIGAQNLLKVPDLVPFTSMPGFGRMISNTPSVYSAIKSCNRLYGRASSVARFFTKEHDHGIWWVRESILPPDVGSRQMELYTLAYMLQVVQLGAGDNWRPARICVERESIPRLDRLEPLAGAEVLRNAGVSAVWIPRPILSRPMRGSAPIGPVDRDRFFADTPSEKFVGSLLQTLRSLVKLGHPRIETVAEIGGVGVRTLQRRLKAEDLTFKALVDHARFLEAADLLAEDVPLVEIAEDLSYSDQAHFNRAFHRWAGVSPSRYRSQLSSG
jgi:AraC-like DNA-binding protein